MERIQAIDYHLLRIIQCFHNIYIDKFMIAMSNQVGWLPMIIFLLFIFIKNANSKKYLFTIILIIAAILVSDYICSGLMKPYFQRLRPCFNTSIASWLRVVNGCGGQYGFASSHASTSFALVHSFILFGKFSKNHRILFYFWASLVCISRMYLGVHYASDVLVGAIIGVFVSYIVNLIYLKFK